MDKQAWWSVLNVSPSASKKEIRTAYLKLSKVYHPDKNPTRREWAEEQFRRISKAREDGLSASNVVFNRTPMYTYKPKAKDIVIKLAVTIKQVLRSESVHLVYSYSNITNQTKRRKITIELDPRTTTTGRTRHADIGHCPAHATPGDVVIDMTVDHRPYTMDGYDLCTTQEITLLEAFQQTEREVTLPDGDMRQIACTWTPGVPFDKFYMKVAFKGLYRPDGTRGHFKIKFRIIAPDVSKKRRNMFVYALDGEIDEPDAKRSKLLT